MATTTLTPTAATADMPKLVKKGSISEAKSPMSATQTVYGCSHIKDLLSKARQPAIDGYTKLMRSISRPGNISTHIHKSTAGTAVESTNGFVLCHECRDFVYDPSFEEIRSKGSSKKRKHAVFSEPGDKRLVATNSGSTPCAATGLRGLYNMGQTCFMSVVLQSLVHNPIIRAYYLAEGHKRDECEREACTSCALDDMFTDFYGQEKHEGYGAVHMLQGCWKGGGSLAGYSQQDAHEFLGFILNSLHTANTGDEDEEATSSSVAKRKGSDTCDCVVHQIFGGVLKSTVTCSSCKNTTTTYDPFTDLSLDIRSAAVAVKKKKLSMINGTATVKEALPMELSECLDRFTASETLSSDSYQCRKCDKAQEAEKRLKISTLPPVLPVHLKRFSHSKSLATSSKVDTKIRFPFTLNLEPYTAQPKAPKPSPPGDQKPAEDGGTGSAKAVEPVYVLSSVVVHKGKIDNGHYVCYCKQEEEWFRFDDSMVVRVDEREVMGAEAYMLFYVVESL
ncbi:hypothetical protein LTR95_000875 [Oleoguttula sp. CCFEE 5521]